jgi:hypothetical protein
VGFAVSEDHNTTGAKHPGLYFSHPACLEHDPQVHMPEHPDTPERLRTIKELALAGGGAIDPDMFVGEPTYRAALHAAGAPMRWQGH